MSLKHSEAMFKTDKKCVANFVLTVLAIKIITFFLLGSEQILLHKVIGIEVHKSELSSKLKDSETKSKDSELNVPKIAYSF